MADLSWFPFRPRSRTPIGLNAPPILDDCDSNQESDDHRGPKPNRISSYISLGSRFSFSPEPSPVSTRASIHVNDVDRVWHNPSTEQMVEALQAIIMTKGVLQPIPIEYNAYILHLIESFRDAHVRIGIANGARCTAQELHHQVEQDFKMVADEWGKREAQYKAEVKRLEVILARTSRDGLETVTLARTNSVVDRGVPDPRQFVTKLRELRNQEIHSKPSLDCDGFNKYDAFLGQPPSTDLEVIKALRSIDDVGQPGETDCSRVVPRVPTIFYLEKDLKASERLRRKIRKPSSRVPNQPVCLTSQFSDTEDYDTGKPPSSEVGHGETRPVTDPPGSHEELRLDDTSCSSGFASEYDGSISTALPDRPQSGVGMGSTCEDDNSGGPFCQPSRNVQRDEGRARYSSFWNEAYTDRTISSGSRFSFIPGDDNTSLPDKCQAFRGVTIDGDRGWEPNEQEEKLLDSQIGMSPSYQNRAVWDNRTGFSLDSAAGGAGLLVASSSGISHGASSGFKAKLLNANSTGSINTVINVVTDRDRQLRIYDPASAKVTNFRDVSQQAEQRGCRSVEDFAEDQTTPSPKASVHRQCSAQITTSHPLQRSSRHDSGSSAYRHA